jgi:hypothetical protein
MLFTEEMIDDMMTFDNDPDKVPTYRTSTRQPRRSSLSLFCSSQRWASLKVILPSFPERRIPSPKVGSGRTAEPLASTGRT